MSRRSSRGIPPRHDWSSIEALTPYPVGAIAAPLMHPRQGCWGCATFAGSSVQTCSTRGEGHAGTHKLWRRSPSAGVISTRADAVVFSSVRPRWSPCSLPSLARVSWSESPRLSATTVPERRQGAGRQPVVLPPPRPTDRVPDRSGRTTTYLPGAGTDADDGHPCDHDHVVVPERGRQLAAGIPGARYVSLPGANHLMLEGEPAWSRFLEELGLFLNW